MSTEHETILRALEASWNGDEAKAAERFSGLEGSGVPSAAYALMIYHAYRWDWPKAFRSAVGVIEDRETFSLYTNHFNEAVGICARAVSQCRDLALGVTIVGSVIAKLDDRKGQMIDNLLEYCAAAERDRPRLDSILVTRDPVGEELFREIGLPDRPAPCVRWRARGAELVAANTAPTEFWDCVHVSAYYASVGRCEEGWDMVKLAIRHWVPVVPLFGEVAPAVLLVNDDLFGLLSRERCAEILRTRRGPANRSS